MVVMDAKALINSMAEVVGTSRAPLWIEETAEPQPLCPHR